MTDTNNSISSRSCFETFVIEHGKKTTMICIITALVAAVFVGLGAAGILPPSGNLPAMITGAAVCLLSIIATSCICKQKRISFPINSTPPTQPPPNPVPNPKPTEKQPDLRDISTCSMSALKFEYLPLAIKLRQIEPFKIGVDRLAEAHELSNNTRDREGLNLFHQIASYGTVEMLEYLSSKLKFSDEKSFKTRQNVIHYAVLGNNPNIIDRFKALGANINSTCQYGRTPIYLAAMNGQIDLVITLVQAGAHTSWRIRSSANDKGQTVYQLVRKDASKQNIKSYLESLPTHTQDTLRTALEDKDFDLFRDTVDTLSKDQLSSYQDNVGRNLFHLIAMYGTTEMLNYLVYAKNVRFEDKAVQYNDGQHKTIHHCIFGNNPSVIAAFKALGADLNAQDSTGDTALHHAVRGGHLECVQALINAGANQKITNSTPGYEEEAVTPYQMLLNMPRANVQLQEVKTYLDSIGNKLDNELLEIVKTCPYHRIKSAFLSKTIQEKNLEAFKAAIDRLEKQTDLNLDLVDTENRNLFHQIAVHGTPEMLAYVLSKKLEFQDRKSRSDDKEQYTVIHYCVLGNNPSLIAPFVACGAVSDTKDHMGKAALHHAVAGLQFECVQALIEAGANPDVTDSKNAKTPYQTLLNIPDKNLVEYQQIKNYLEGINGSSSLS